MESKRPLRWIRYGKNNISFSIKCMRDALFDHGQSLLYKVWVLEREIVLERRLLQTNGNSYQIIKVKHFLSIGLIMNNVGSRTSIYLCITQFFNSFHSCSSLFSSSMNCLQSLQSLSSNNWLID